LVRVGSAKAARRIRPTACHCSISDSISLSVSSSFHLSFTVLVHYRSLNIFRLGKWSPLARPSRAAQTRFHVSRFTYLLGPQWGHPLCSLSRANTSPYWTITIFGGVCVAREARTHKHMLIQQHSGTWFAPKAQGCVSMSTFARHYLRNLV